MLGTSRCVSGIYIGTSIISYLINNIVDDIQANVNFFADNTSLSVVDPADARTILQSGINKISQQAQNWLFKFNLSKSESLLISRKRIKPKHPNLYMLNTEISSVKNHKHLDMYLTNDGS